jgi:hypothetical protein
MIIIEESTVDAYRRWNSKMTLNEFSIDSFASLQVV